VPGAGGLEIELLSPRAIEPGKPAPPQGGARTQREASSLWLSTHYRADAAGGLRGQRETSSTASERRRHQGEKKQRRMKRLGISTAERQRAERPGQVWSWDFVAGRASRKITNCLKDHGQSRSKADEDQAQSLPFPFFLSPLPPLPLCS
jgi:hypothetical protein